MPEQSEYERIVSNLICVGTIKAVDPNNARAKVNAQGLITDWLPWVCLRAGSTRTWSAPTVGEQVLLLSPSGNLSQGCIIPAIYQDQYAAPSSDPNVERVQFSDGSIVEHNSASSTLLIDVKSSVTIKSPSVVIDGNLTVKGKTKLEGSVEMTGTDVSHGGVNIGKEHRHNNVRSGPDNTGKPI